MSMAELMESITDEVIGQLEHDASQREIEQDSEMSLVEFAERIAPFPLSDLQKELFRKYEEECTKGNDVVLVQASRSCGKRFIMQAVDEWKKLHQLSEHRCSRCNRLLGKFNGQAEIKCPKCGKINRIGVK